MKNALDECPICHSELIVTELFCSHCATTITGQFAALASPLSKLNTQQINFVLTFIRCEGKLNRMEEKLNLSYPTLKNRLNEVLSAMGFDSEKENRSLSKEDRLEVLRQLEVGDIDPDEAEKRLRGISE